MPLSRNSKARGSFQEKPTLDESEYDNYGVALVEAKNDIYLVYQVGPMDPEGRFNYDLTKTYVNPIEAYNELVALISNTPFRRLHPRCRRVYRDLKRVVEQLSEQG